VKHDLRSSTAPLRLLPAPVRGLISFVLLSLNTVVFSVAIFPLAVVKLIAPVAGVRRRIDRLLHGIIERWIAGNGVWIALTRNVTWSVEGIDRLRIDGWYLVVANHQSWADIFVLQKVLTRRIPPLKFPLKRRLIWVPFAGFAWWALDFPFMSRHSEEFLRKHPERRGDDLVAIREACEKFCLVPTTLASFIEGTRFTREKHASQQSEYRHLLRPRAGGLALALDSMGEQFEALLDITIFYPDGAPSFLGFLSGRAERVVVQVRERSVPRELTRGDYTLDPEFRERVREWINEIWAEKDQVLESLHRSRDGRRE
jgi:1-acyl-sn-glycerol-3-phosphate acyltransferase